MCIRDRQEAMSAYQPMRDGAFYSSMSANELERIVPGQGTRQDITIGSGNVSKVIIFNDRFPANISDAAVRHMSFGGDGQGNYF